MTAETDLLPLPDDLALKPQPIRDAARAYARANLAELQREVEGLRLRLHRIETGLTEQISFHVEQVEQAEARAERLAEALRGITEVYAAMRETLEQKYPQDGWSANTMTLDAARAALDQETTNG